MRAALLSILGVLAIGACADSPGPVAPDSGGLDRSPLVDHREASRPGDLGADARTELRCPGLRSTVDRPDDTDLYQARPLYVLPADGKDESLDTGRICTSVRAFSHWLARQTGGRTLRLDTHGGELDIGFVQLGLSNAELEGSTWEASIETGYKYVRDRIERELKKLGVLKPNKLYMVYYGGTSIYACGGAAYPPTLVGQVSAVYIKGQPQGGYPCESDPWGVSPETPHYLDYSILHDTLHSLGIVAADAPHHHSSGHVFDGVQPNRDLMYQPRVGASDPPWDTYNQAGLLLDPDRDDYFEHGKPGLVDLARSVFLSPLPANPSKPPSW